MVLRQQEDQLQSLFSDFWALLTVKKGTKLIISNFESKLEIIRQTGWIWTFFFKLIFFLILRDILTLIYKNLYDLRVNHCSIEKHELKDIWKWLKMPKIALNKTKIICSKTASQKQQIKSIQTLSLISNILTFKTFQNIQNVLYAIILETFSNVLHVASMYHGSKAPRAARPPGQQ